MPGWAKTKGDESKIKTRMMTGILIVALVAVSAGVAAARYDPGGAGVARYEDADGDGIQNGQDDNHAPSRDGCGRCNGGQGCGCNR